MKKLFALISVLIVFQNAFSQPTIQWDKTIGGNSFDELTTIRQTSDGGYILGGFSNSGISGDKTENTSGAADYWVVKLNSSGMLQWENTIGGDSGDFFDSNSFIQTQDGGYILGGSSRSNISGDKTENCRGDYDYWVVKLNSSGVVQWDKTIGGNDEDRLYSVIQSVDGGYLLGGYSSSNISGDKTDSSRGYLDFWIVKLNQVGSIQWQKTIGGEGGDGLISMGHTADGGYILGGISASNISGDKTDTCRGGSDYWIVKIDSVGDVQWDKTIGGSNDDGLESVSQTSDGGYIIAGSSLSNISGDKTENLCNNNQGDYWIIKLDSAGSIAWQNDIGSNGDNIAYSAFQISSGEYIVGGYSDGNIFCDKTENSKGGTDDWILKLDTSGNIVWQKTIGGSNDDGITSMQQTADGGYILGGTSSSNISGDKTANSKGLDDYWVVKLAPEVGIEEPNHIYVLNIFPNPASDELSIKDSEFKIKEILINDAVGREIYSSGFVPSINVSFWSNGIYFVKLKTSDEIKTLKLLVQH